MKEPLNHKIEETDVDQRSIFFLIIGLILGLALISFGLLKLNRHEFKTQATAKNFSREEHQAPEGELDDFETGVPREKLNEGQEKNLTNLEKAMESLSTMSLSDVDHFFINQGRVKK